MGLGGYIKKSYTLKKIRLVGGEELEKIAFLDLFLNADFPIFKLESISHQN